jgi:tetratricopeptide (TPR) repeat protein
MRTIAMTRTGADERDVFGQLMAAVRPFQSNRDYDGAIHHLLRERETFERGGDRQGAVAAAHALSLFLHLADRKDDALAAYEYIERMEPSDDNRLATVRYLASIGRAAEAERRLARVREFAAYLDYEILAVSGQVRLAEGYADAACAVLDQLIEAAPRTRFPFSWDLGLVGALVNAGRCPDACRRYLNAFLESDHRRPPSVDQDVHRLLRKLPEPR